MTELNELKYIDYIVKETLRLYPVLPFLTRTTSEDIELGKFIYSNFTLLCPY